MRRKHTHRRLLIAEIRLANICLVLVALAAVTLGILGPWAAAAAKAPPPDVRTWFTLVIVVPALVFLFFTAVNLIIYVVRLVRQPREHIGND